MIYYLYERRGFGRRWPRAAIRLGDRLVAVPRILPDGHIHHINLILSDSAAPHTLFEATLAGGIRIAAKAGPALTNEVARLQKLGRQITSASYLIDVGGSSAVATLFPDGRIAAADQDIQAVLRALAASI